MISKIHNISYSIRKYGASIPALEPYTIADIGYEICGSPIAYKAHQQIIKEGYIIRLNYNHDSSAGRTLHTHKIIDIFMMHQYSLADVVGTIVHESVHVEYRDRKKVANNTQYEEYTAFIREQVYRNSKNPYISTELTAADKLEIWEEVKDLYPNLKQGTNPFGGYHA